MCGQVGIIFGETQRSRSELSHIRMIFAHLLLLSEGRGPHATGAAWLKQDGTHNIVKQPVRASQFLRTGEFLDLLAGVDSDVTWLAGHTRWQTRGDAANNYNNHPIRAGNVIGTHNGTITNADALFDRFRLPRFAEVDSEIIFRLAQTTLAKGHIDVAALKDRLRLCQGEISAVMASKQAPSEVVIIKGNKPLEMKCNKDRRLIVYASDARYLDMVLADEREWQYVKLRPMTIATFLTDNLETTNCQRFQLDNPAKGRDSRGRQRRQCDRDQT